MRATVALLVTATCEVLVDRLRRGGRGRCDTALIDSLFRAERFVSVDVCESCLPVAASLPRPADAYTGGPRCDRDYFTGAPRVEACNVTGDGWGGPPSKRLKMRCPVTKNDDEAAAGG